MRLSLTIILILFFLKFTLGQSPFNYGQNKNIYFISTELRNKLIINEIYTIDQRHDNDLGGMGENWDVTLISFDTNSITDDWYPIILDSTFEYNFDSLTSNMQFLNGTRYEFSGGKLLSYGGGGYGSFDWNEITRLSDTISLVATSCVGHCGNQAIVNYSKNVFDKNGLLLYSVSYPTFIENDEFNFESIDQIEYEKFLQTGITSENLPDTTYFKYNQGLLVNPKFNNDGVFPENKFHQCYVGNIKMEKYFTSKLGYTPKLILIEIYKYGVFSFSFNTKDKKYYQTNSIILEQ